MTDEYIRHTIYEAMINASTGPLGRLSRAEEIDIAALAAAVRLMREPGLPEGWRAKMWDDGKGGQIISSYHDGDTYTASRWGKRVGVFPTLAEAIAAVTEARSE